MALIKIDAIQLWEKFIANFLCSSLLTSEKRKQFTFDKCQDAGNLSSEPLNTKYEMLIEDERFALLSFA